MPKALQVAALVDPRTGHARWLFVHERPETIQAQCGQPAWAAKKAPKAIRAWLGDLLALTPPMVPELRVLGASKAKAARKKLLEHWLGELEGEPLLNRPAPPEAPRKPGRPTAYTPEVAGEILHRLAGGESLRSILRSEHLPHRVTVLRWAIDNEEFRNQYALARELYCDHLAEETQEIADDGTNDWYDRETADGRVERTLDHEHIQRSRLRIDQRKWHLAQMSKRYHPRQVHQIEGAPDAPLGVQPHLPPMPAELSSKFLDFVRLALQGQADE